MPVTDPFVKRFPTLAAVLLLTCGLAWSQTDSATTDSNQPDSAAPAKAATVALTIDFGDGFEKRYTAIPYIESMTVLSVLEAARAHPHATSFSFRGQGATAFLKEIDGVRNEGAAGRNWIFYVNQEKGKESFGQRKLKASDVVMWRLERY